ncbi:Transposase, Rhodopirellula-type, partial [Candidatus Magnetomorum sp. HK-1]
LKKKNTPKSNVRLFGNAPQATPLINYETVLKYTKSTKTTTGLKVNAVTVEKKYQKGIKATKDELNNLNIKYHEKNSSWNYTLYPN